MEGSLLSINLPFFLVRLPSKYLGKYHAYLHTYIHMFMLNKYLEAEPARQHLIGVYS